MLTFFAVNDSRTGILANGELAFGGYFGIAKESKGYILIVVGSFGVGKDFGYLFVVSTTKQERNIAESLIYHTGKTFGFDFQNGFAFKFTHRYVVLGQQVVFRIVLSKLEHGRILKFRSLCHN